MEIDPINPINPNNPINPGPDIPLPPVRKAMCQNT